MKYGRINVPFCLAGCLLFLILAGCAAMSPHLSLDDSRLPPILTQSDLSRDGRTYESRGRIQVKRDVYITDGLAPPDIRAWGLLAIRREAAKMGADAVIFPEVSGTHTMAVVLPSTEYRATGIAIKFK